MEVVKTAIPGVMIVEPKRFGDARGFFTELYRAERYAAAGIALPFVQDNFSRSAQRRSARPAPAERRTRRAS